MLWLLAIGLAVAIVAGIDWQAGQRERAAEAAYPPKGQIVDVDGVGIHVYDAGGTGPDLVLIHGANGNIRDFSDALLNRLTQAYRVWLVDRPGLGWSDRSDPEYLGPWSRASESPAEQARVLQAAVARLGVERPLVLGHSFGGAVALAWALERPDHIAGLVVVSGASNPWPDGLGAFYNVSATRLGGATFVPFVTAFASKAQANTVIARIFAPQEAPKDYARLVGVPLSLRRESQRANTRQVTSLLPHVVEMSARYGAIAVPTEILHGTADDIVPLAIHSEPLAQQIPDAVLTRLDGIGHMPHHATPEAVIDAVDRAAARAGLR